MPKFITTIQLQDANEKDYNFLSLELERESFKEEVHAAKSDAYITGKGSFSCKGNLSITEVNEAIFRAASRTGKKYSFFTIKLKRSIASQN